MNDFIFSTGLSKLEQYIKDTRNLCVNDHQFMDGNVIIRFLNISDILVLDIIKFRDAISFFPNTPTNQEDQKDRDELIAEIDKQLKN